MPPTAGIVLCGGRSSRMGRAKAWLPFGDETLLQRTVRIVSEAVGPVVVVAAPRQELPPLPAGVEIVRDIEEGQGPLGGLAAGLAALDGRAEAVYLSACDAPFLTAEFVRTVVGHLGTYAAAVPVTDGYPHPLAAVYRMSVRPTVERRLAEDSLRLRDLFDEVPTRFLGPEAFADLAALTNVNTLAEYEAALKKLQGTTNHTNTTNGTPPRAGSGS